MLFCTCSFEENYRGTSKYVLVYLHKKFSARGTYYDMHHVWLRFEHALKDLVCEPDTGTSTILEAIHTKYQEKYDECVRTIIKSAQASSVEARSKANDEQEKSYKMEIQLEAKLLHQDTFTKKGGLQLWKQPDRFGTLLGLVCAAWTYLDCKDGGTFATLKVW